MSYSSNEVKSGVLIAVSLVLLFVLTFIVGSFVTGETKTYQVRFGYIAGLEDNSPVYYSGREVGKVDLIEVFSDQEEPVLLTIRIAADIDLREDTDAFIDTLGMMGEKLVELTSGSVDKPVLKSGAVINGTDPIPMYLLISKMNLLADRMDTMTEVLTPMVTQFDAFFSG